MRKQNAILIAALLALLVAAMPVEAQTGGYSQLFAYSRVYPSGADAYIVWGPTSVPNSGIARADPVGITDFYYDHYFEAGQEIDCRAGYDCLSHPYISSGDTIDYQYIDNAWYFPNSGPFRFRVEPNGYTHTAKWLNGSTWQQIGQTQTNTFISLPFVFMGYESITNSKLDKPIFFSGAQYYALGAWYNFCPTTFLDSGNNGAMFYPCSPSFSGAFSVLPGVRVFLPQQRRP